jgi:hypothetical protein
MEFGNEENRTDPSPSLRMTGFEKRALGKVARRSGTDRQEPVPPVKRRLARNGVSRLTGGRFQMEFGSEETLPVPPRRDPGNE